MQKLAVTVNEAAGALGVSPDSVRRSIADGQLRSIRFRDRVLVPISEMERVVNNAQQESDADHDEQGVQVQE